MDTMMRGANLLLFSCFALSSLSFFPDLLEATSELDIKYWNERAKEASKYTKSLYDPNPNAVTASIRSSVVQFLADPQEVNQANSTRRGLRQKKGKGPCIAANPIDKCWRCDPNWAKNRQRLADCVQGFGRRTTGGKGGRYYVVTDPSDDDLVNPRPGTLRHAVIQTEPLWIIFARSMIIKLEEELIMFNNKTIDGRGANVHIANGAGITIQHVSNVIIHGLHIHDIKPSSGGMIRDSIFHFGQRTRSDGDGISIFHSSNVWIDHNSMYRCSDGLVDVIYDSTAVTISNNHFTRHDEVMLFGASDTHTNDRDMQVTVAFNHFGKYLTQRMPRVRFGFVHLLNNDYTYWQMYAVGGSRAPTIISEGNRYFARDAAETKSVTKKDFLGEDSSGWVWKSIDDLFLNGAYFEESGSPYVEDPNTRLDIIPRSKGKAVGRLTRDAGTLLCRRGRPC